MKLFHFFFFLSHIAMEGFHKYNQPTGASKHGMFFFDHTVFQCFPTFQRQTLVIHFKIFKHFSTNKEMKS